MTSTGGMNGHPVPGVGHNSGPAVTAFEEVVKTNLKEGLLLAIKHTIVTAHRDGRLERRHYRVLCEIIDVINTRSGMAFPGQALLAEKSGYTVAVIRKTVSELIQFGYLVNTRRAPAGSTRALAHYTIRRPSIEEMHAAISAW